MACHEPELSGKQKPLTSEIEVSGSWWAGKDSHLRRREPADLQSAPFDCFGTDPELLAPLEFGASPVLQQNENLFRFASVQGEPW